MKTQYSQKINKIISFFRQKYEAQRLRKISRVTQPGKKKKTTELRSELKEPLTPGHMFYSHAGTRLKPQLRSCLEPPFMGWGQASPPNIQNTKKLSILPQKEREGTPKEHFNCHRIQTIPTKGPVVIRKHTNPYPPFLQHFQIQGILSHQVIELFLAARVSSLQMQLVLIMIICYAVKSPLAPLTDDAPEIIGQGETKDKD